MSHVNRTPLGAATSPSKWYLDLNTGTYGAPTWIAVNGVSDFKPKLEPTLKDDSDYDSAGFGSQAKTGLAWSADVTVGRKVTIASPTVYDPGQEALRVAAASLATTRIVDVRWYEVTTGGPIAEAYRGQAEVGWGQGGGKYNDLEEVTIALSGRGERVAITHPDYTQAVPTITSITPSAVAAAGGDLVKITGTGFFKAGVDDVVASTGIKSGGGAGTAFDSWIVESDNVIFAITPAGTGTEAVVVYNAAGISTVTQNLVYS